MFAQIKIISSIAGKLTFFVQWVHLHVSPGIRFDGVVAKGALEAEHHFARFLGRNTAFLK